MTSLKSAFQTVLKRLGLYQRLKTSVLYDVYWRLADRRVMTERSREIEFYRYLLAGFRKGDLIFDIGANHGQKTDIFLRLGAEVIAVEPDTMNQEILRQRFLSYRFIKRPMKIVGKAVSDKRALERMWINAPGSAVNTLSQKWVDTLRVDQSRFGTALDFAATKEIETVTLDDLFITHGVPFFVKIDVEGYEPNVLRGLRRPLPYLSFEVNLPEFGPEGLECIELLGRVAESGKFNYTTDCQRGLGLGHWIGKQEFLKVFKSCTEPSIEVFWKTHVSAFGRDNST
jgi:FkbM family methyltransferase